ncbi:MAG: ABC transporter permease [Bacteroidales bacterium]|nr:ABC transporter permease [Bacteroidales bacterium]
MSINIRDVPPAPVKATPGFLDLSRLNRSVLLAVRSLWLHKLRASLSVLGIVIGTSAVISLMAFGKGSMADALNDIKKQGTNIIVRSVKPSDDSSTGSRSFVVSYGLTFRDLERFETFGDTIGRTVPMRVFPSEVRYLERMQNARLVATTNDYAAVNHLQVARGRFITSEDNRNLTNNCVLGATLADRLFPTEDPIGQSVLVRGHRFRIVGVMDNRMPTGGTGGSSAAEDYNLDIYIPFSTCRARIGETVIVRASGSRSGEKVAISQVVLTVNADFETREGRERVKAVGESIKNILKEEHYKDDWAVTVPLDRLEEAERQQQRFTSLLVLIASISLIVGGIGIMNIMLATVTERTREIGIRRALGAKRRDIITQFLVEAVVQTTVGGLAGVIIGLGIVFGIPPLWNLITGSMLPALLSYWSILLSVGVSIVVGVMFGLYPAWQAARLDPIEALRHD